MSIVSEIQRIKNNIAAAYSACESKGAELPQLQNSNNLATTIESISSGGSAPVERKNINFYDYDGTLLYSYTESEAEELSELPSLPVHDGLIAVGWTHTLLQIKQASQDTNVGCYYITSDGKTHIHIELKKSGTFEFGLIQSAANAAVIDWGDGSPTETLSISDGAKNNRTRYKASHIYSPSSYPAEYDISISAVSGQWYGFGTNGQSGYGITHGDASFGNCIKRIHLSEDANLKAGCFYCAGGMEVITCSESQSQIFGLQYSFSNCYSLRYIIAYAADSGSFNNCRSLRTITFRPDFSPTHTIYEDAFCYCLSLKEIVIPQGVTTIGRNAFGNCESAERIVIPSSVVTIEYSAFYGTDRSRNRLNEVDLTAFTDLSALPTLSYNLSVTFSYQNYTEGYVPFIVANAQMKEAFGNDTNWSSQGTDLFIVKEVRS